MRPRLCILRHRECAGEEEEGEEEGEGKFAAFVRFAVVRFPLSAFRCPFFS
jgi:hypothetical protein